jgi:sensor histidine kinase YesM
MKTEKSNIYFKKSYFLLLKLGLWGIFCWIFVNFSFLIPMSSDSLILELVVFLFLAIAINIHTSYLCPKIAKKNSWVYVLLLLGSILICSLFELLIFSETFDPAFYPFLDKKKLFFITFGCISIRNLALFIFFLWIEYFYHLIQLLNTKDAVYQKEISLLLEKQEFEKKFSRKKLLPHYFFNILEHINVENSLNNNDSELISKIKFILYYFLVDAELEKVELDKELAFYQYYIELENFRHEKKIAVNFNVLGQTEGYFILPLLFEPLIGNAMKYTKKDGNGLVNITVDATRLPVLNFCCNNNYSSYSLNTNSSESGLKILEQRLELCYKDNYTLKINQNDGFYEVTLTIVLI